MHARMTIREITDAQPLPNHLCIVTVVHMKILPKPGAIYGVTKRLDISRDELARRMKVSTATAYRIDAGKVEPSPAFIAGLINVSGQPFEDLFDIVGADLEAVSA